MCLEASKIIFGDPCRGQVLTGLASEMIKRMNVNRCTFSTAPTIFGVKVKP